MLPPNTMLAVSANLQYPKKPLQTAVLQTLCPEIPCCPNSAQDDATQLLELEVTLSDHRQRLCSQHDTFTAAPCGMPPIPTVLWADTTEYFMLKAWKGRRVSLETQLAGANLSSCSAAEQWCDVTAGTATHDTKTFLPRREKGNSGAVRISKCVHF